MNLGKLFKDFHLEKVKLNLKAVQFEVSFQEADKDAAWDLYVEMLTRIVTQPLPPEVGDEQATLESVYSLAPATRESCGTMGGRRFSSARSRCRC